MDTRTHLRPSIMRRVGVCAAMATITLALAAAQAQAQIRTTTRIASSTQDYTLNGIQAWSTAKTSGFTFQPLTYGSNQQVTRPRDGVNTRLIRTYQDRRLLGATRTEVVAQVTGGNPSVNKARQTVTFEMFGGQTLAPGWTVQGVSLSGSYVWDRRPQTGSNTPVFRIKVTGTGGVTVRSVSLRGPAGANPADAFAGRKQWTVQGTIAWGEAKKYGFTFRPLTNISATAMSWSSGSPTNVDITPPHDGVSTQMIWLSANPTRERWNCVSPASAARGCLLSAVTGGTASVQQPLYDGWRTFTVQFELFGTKRLAPGWTLRSIDLAGGTWVRRPSAGSDDLTSVFSLTSYPSRGAGGHIRSIVLEGPSTASGWQDAFRGAR